MHSTVVTEAYQPGHNGASTVLGTRDIRLEVKTKEDTLEFSLDSPTHSSTPSLMILCPFFLDLRANQFTFPGLFPHTWDGAGLPFRGVLRQVTDIT